MLREGIVNPEVLSLVGRVRHTNTLVIADVGFPFWPAIETVDLSLIRGVPSVLQVLEALLPNFIVGQAWMASEFLQHNDHAARDAVERALPGVSLQFEEHVAFKRRVPGAIGLIRTGDTTLYANIILESA